MPTKNMKIKFKETQAGHTEMWLKDRVYDLPDHEAVGWVRAGRAKLVTEDDAPPKRARKTTKKPAAKKTTRPVK